MKGIKWIYRIVCALPLLAYLTYYSYIFRVMIFQGKNAFVGDPSSLGYNQHNQLVWWAFNNTFYGVLLWLAITLILYFTPYRIVLITKQHLKLFFGGVFCCLCWFVDPFMGWFLD
jgi:hypothetical protein